jgi:hypothetical protein
MRLRGPGDDGAPPGAALPLVDPHDRRR